MPHYGSCARLTYAYIGFDRTGDFMLGNGLKKLGGLLDRGIKVALVYGDRDYQCNWLGGEAISLAIESKLSSGFKKAGYANIETNAEYVGGFVRQYGNLSFARVFDAAHEGESPLFPASLDIYMSSTHWNIDTDKRSSVLPTRDHLPNLQPRHVQHRYRYWQRTHYIRLLEHRSQLCLVDVEAADHE
jgi:hypothetical protein